MFQSPGWRQRFPAAAILLIFPPSQPCGEKRSFSERRGAAAPFCERRLNSPGRTGDEGGDITGLEAAIDVDHHDVGGTTVEHGEE